jgi:uncharacterized protein YegL
MLSYLSSFIFGSSTPVQEASQSTKIVMLLDSSGSMISHQWEVITAVNKFIELQKGTGSASNSTSSSSSVSASNNCQFSLVTFNSSYKVEFDEIKLTDMPAITKANYVPNGSTALYDAIGFVIDCLKDTKKVILIIITDGLDNTSHLYTQKQVADMINDRNKAPDAHWNIIYLAANPSLVKQGLDMNISQSSSCNISNFSKHVESILSKTVSDIRQNS